MSNMNTFLLGFGGEYQIMYITALHQPRTQTVFNKWWLLVGEKLQDRTKAVKK